MTYFTEDNQIFVNIKGDISYDDKPAKVLVQFLFNSKADFEYNALKINGKAHDEEMADILINLMFEQAK